MSRIDFGAKPLMLPQPVLIVGTYDENGIPNAMNAAWELLPILRRLQSVFQNTRLQRTWQLQGHLQ